MLNVLIFPRHWEKMEYSWEGIGMQCDFHNYFRKSEGEGEKRKHELTSQLAAWRELFGPLN